MNKVYLIIKQLAFDPDNLTFYPLTNEIYVLSLHHQTNIMTTDQLLEKRNTEINNLLNQLQEQVIIIKERDIKILQLEQQIIDLTIQNLKR